MALRLEYLFIAKLDTSGNLQWTKALDSTGTEKAYSIKLGASHLNSDGLGTSNISVFPNPFKESLNFS